MMRTRFGFLGSSTAQLGKMALSLSLMAGITACGLAVIVRGIPAAAQQKPRSVSGKVVDKGDAPLKGSVVYLKDDHSLAVKSFIADDGGTFRFGQLSQSTDYELWAEFNGRKSNTRTISSFDSKNEFVINLKVDTSK